MTIRLEDVNAGFAALRQLMRDCGPNTSKDDKTFVLIAAAIEAGFDTRRRIVGVARTLGFKPERAAALLDEGVGQRWRVSEGGVYTTIA